jgi:hypothetical protein
VSDAERSTLRQLAGVCGLPAKRLRVCQRQCRGLQLVAQRKALCDEKKQIVSLRGRQVEQSKEMSEIARQQVAQGKGASDKE